MAGAFPRGTTMHHELLRQQAIQFGEVPLHERIAANALPGEASDKGVLLSPLQKGPLHRNAANSQGGGQALNGRPLSALAIVGETDKSALRKKSGQQQHASFSLPRPEWDVESAQSKQTASSSIPTKRPGTGSYGQLRTSSSVGTIRQ